MKLVKIVDNSEALGKFLMGNLPRTLIVKRSDDGYGWSYKVKRADKPRWWHDTVAIVGADEVWLYDPSWFSDFEDCVKQFERQVGREVRFTYYES